MYVSRIISLAQCCQPSPAPPPLPKNCGSFTCTAGLVLRSNPASVACPTTGCTNAQVCVSYNCCWASMRWLKEHTGTKPQTSGISDSRPNDHLQCCTPPVCNVATCASTGYKCTAGTLSPIASSVMCPNGQCTNGLVCRHDYLIATPGNALLHAPTFALVKFQ
jgi:hypothetical protein